ncbi:MAG: glycosyl hydrolase family 65 protein [Kiritimatiellia bacterium]
MNDRVDSGAEEWELAQNSYSPADEGLWGTLLTLSNGYYGFRGNLELPSAGREPGVYLAGVYDKPDVKEQTEALGLDLRNKAVTPAYAVAPIWNLVELEINGLCVDFMNAEVPVFSRSLDMKRGLLTSTYELRDSEDRTTRLRFVSAALLTHRRLCVMQCDVEPLDYEGLVTLRFCCEQPDRPQYIPRLKDYVSHTNYTGFRRSPDGNAVAIAGQVEQTGAVLALASRTHAHDSIELHVEERPKGVAETFRFEVKPGGKRQFRRLCAVGHGQAGCDVPAVVLSALTESAKNREHGGQVSFGETVDKLVENHTAAWELKWKAANFAFNGDGPLLRGVRWNLFSLRQLGHFHSPDYSISATGLHGQGYFGHVFWDTDIYMLPVYILTAPETARDLLLYRYERLDAARTVAREHGFKGAKFPWTSTRDGRDVCPPDWERCGRRQIHISGDIAYAFHNYREWTADEEFYMRYGVEVVVETARFFLSRTVEGEDGLLHIMDVIGPDEYNIHADDNAYTNFLARWNLRQAVSSMDELRSTRPDAYRDLARRIGWSEGERETLDDAEKRIAFPRVRNGVIEQYAGFFDLKDPGEIKRDENNMPVERLHSYNRGYQILKQADAVMTFFLFPDAFPEREQKRTFEYYERRNTFASSLSASVSCIAGLRLGLHEHAYSYFRLTNLLEIQNLHFDRNTNEGIHAACAGGACLSAFLGYGGLRLQDGALSILPTLPQQWTDMQFHFQFRGRRVEVEADGTGTTVYVDGSPHQGLLA